MCFANIPRKWAELRFAVIGPLLTSPPGPRELAGRIAELAEQHWLHPVTGNPVHFGCSTIERWYYIAREAQDPIAALTRKVRKDRGVFTALTPEQGAILHAQYREHPGWSLRLHTDNLCEHIRLAPEIGVDPSMATVRRFMIAHALVRRPRRGPGQTPASLRAEQRLFTREVRSYEHSHVGALWHLDFHSCSRQVLTAAGNLVTPQLLAIIDDHSRLICHAQWYLDENAQNVVHGLIQAVLRRGLLRALMTDRGTAMMAHEVVQGLQRLGISHDPTLGHSPDQNGKIESFWTSVEGRLMAMLEGEPMLTLRTLNEATHAWVECEVHRSVHSETGQLPIERFLNAPSVLRPSPSSEDLHAAFLAEVTRIQRRSDATISLAARRFEIPNRYRNLRRLSVRFAAWDLSRVLLVDPRTQKVLAPLYPIDKQRNADARRRRLDPIGHGELGADNDTVPPPSGIAPLLRRYLEEHAATGLPAPYIPIAAEIASAPESAAAADDDGGSDPRKRR